MIKDKELSDFQFTIRDGVATVYEHGYTFKLNLESARLRVENTKRCRSAFGTEAAYQRSLDNAEAVLRALDGEGQ